MSARDIYDIESAVENGIASVFSDAEVKCYTPLDSLTMQRERPHIEAMCVIGAGNQRFVVIDPDTGEAISQSSDESWKYRRESAWDCTINLSLITDADITLHRDFMSSVRNILHSLWLGINNTTTMQRHCFYFVRDGGASPLMMDQDKGYFRTDFNFQGKVSIQADAWPRLGITTNAIDE